MNTTTPPLVSIIIPVYNTGRYAEESIRSALDQTYASKEIIVIDDGSQAETKAILQDLKSKVDMLITQENAGQSTARNIGAEKANGDYILILDSDDKFDTSFVEKALPILEHQPEVKFVSCYLNRFNGDSVGPVVEMQGGPLENYLFRNASIGNGLFRKEELLAVGGYDEAMRSGYEDWELAIRMLKEGGRVYVIPEPLFMYRSNLKLTTKKAASKKPELLSYIFKKHQDIYGEHVEKLIDFFEKEQRVLTNEIQKKLQSKDYKLGNTILRPLRYIKSVFKK